MAGRGFTLEYVERGSPLFSGIHDLCYEVLQKPFGVTRDDDWSDDDPTTEHLVALDEAGEVIAYARLITHGDDAQIRQVAVAFGCQRNGVGSAVMEALVERALERPARVIWLNARVPAIAFYERLGFEAIGDEFQTGRTNVSHRRMEYRTSGERVR